MNFTHRYDTSNEEDSCEKDIILQKSWRRLLSFFLQRSTYIKIKYWPGDLEFLERPHHFWSAFGVKSLKTHAADIKTIIDLGMEELICPVNSETREILLKEDQDSECIQTSPWFHVELLDSEENTIFYSGDNGSDMLMVLSDSDIVALNSYGIVAGSLIEQPELISK